MSRIYVQVAVLLFCFSACGACTSPVYVDRNAPGPACDGSSWATAFTTISDAVDASRSGAHIWIKAGLYRECVTLDGYFRLYGGFLGHETSVDQRLAQAFPTIIDARRRGRAVDITPGSVVSIDGLTIRGGLSDRGGGIRCDTNSNVTISHCRIEHCEATQLGGGIYYGFYTQGEMTGCVLMRNQAPKGGAVVVEYHSYPTLSGCVIARNTASEGGGVYCPYHSGALLDHCTLAYNTASTTGGAVHARQGSPVVLSHCIVAFNSAPAGGGAFGEGNSSQMQIDHCDFYSNDVGDLGGAIDEPPAYAGKTYVDPQFLRPEYDEFHLNPESPCVDMGAYPPNPVCDIERIGVAKLLPDGIVVRLNGKLVSCVDGNTLYIQERDRSSGIAVVGLSGYGEGDVLASVTGTLNTNSHDLRVIQASSSSLFARAAITPNPLGAPISCIKTLDGLLTRTWGRVNGTAAIGFVIYDGASHLYVKSAAPVDLGDYVAVTGVFTAVQDFKAAQVNGF